MIKSGGPILRTTALVTWTQPADHNEMTGFWDENQLPECRCTQKDDLWIPIVGEAGDTVVNATYLWLRDDDKLSTTLTLSTESDHSKQGRGFEHRCQSDGST